MRDVKILQFDCRSVPGVAEPSAIERAIVRRRLLVLRAGRAFVVVDAVLKVPLGGADEGADALVHLTHCVQRVMLRRGFINVLQAKL